MNKFNVNTIPLKGSNLIEASAGTGKTYSLSLLALRLMLEKDIPINKILMVTFTEAAVAELEERLRKCIRSAYEYCHQQVLDEVDPNTQSILDKALSKNKEHCQTVLKNNLLLLDEIPVFTIHSFCHRTLNEFSFETKQLFEKELLTDTTKIIDEAINHYWRNSITTLDDEILEVIHQYSFNRDHLKKIVSRVISGFTFEGDFLDELTPCPKSLNQLQLKKEKKECDLKNTIVTHWEAIVTFCSTNSLAKKHLSKHIKSKEEFTKVYREKYLKSQPAYLKKAPTEIVEIADQLIEASNELDTYCNKITQSLYKNACQEIVRELEKQKSIKNFQTFDDLITNVHTSLTSNNSQVLSEELQKKYHAVFIDEFQDTDSKQYQIFYNAFRSIEQNTIIFYIGDPKQSIYAFRQADIETYKQSRKGSSCYSMDTNYRSTENYIDALNHLFLSYPQNNFFNDNEIRYQEVQSSKKSNLKFENDQEHSPASLSFFYVEKKNDSHQAIANRVSTLLNTYKINKQNITPSDIGIIVRKKKDGSIIKTLLNNNNIPAIVVDDIKIFTTDEAKYIQYIIEAIHHVNNKNINKVMLSILTDIDIEGLLKLNENQIINIFKNLQNEYQQYGPYHALISFSKIFNVQLNLLNQENGSGERSLSNYLQLINLINQQSIKYNLNIEKLIQWLAHQRAVQDEQDDDFNQRIESDDDAVNIVTIHKSKGLSYNIVLTESAQLKTKRNPKSIEYLNEESHQYATSLATNDAKTMDWFEKQTEKEHRRLIYVTLTRAVYKSEVILSKEKQYANTAINSLLGNMDPHPEIEISECEMDVDNVEYISSQKKGKVKARIFNESTYKNNPWTITSFSNLNKQHESFSPLNFNTKLDLYEDFLYNQLPRGASFGNFIHAVFEKLNFQNLKNTPEVIKQQSIIFGNNLFKSDQLPLYNELISHVLNSVLSTNEESFKLSEISNKNKLIETEFHYTFDKLIEKQIVDVFDKPIQFNEIYHKGYMHGFIDLCFKYKQKFYILDWKSNYCGNHLEAYNQEALEMVMNLNNYHLQYFIYTIAMCKHLKSTIPNFGYDKDFGGVFYCFMRGCRADMKNGIYFYKPRASSITPFL